MGQFVKRIPFPHSSIGPFISCIKDYFNEWVYDFKFTVVGTYQKSIQLIEQKKNEMMVEKMGALTPILSFTPQLVEPVIPVDLNWKYSNLHPYQVKWNQRPLIKSGSTYFYVITRRMMGNIDMRIFCDSPMEMHDVYLSVLDAFRGLNKVSILPRIKQYLVVANEILVYEDEHKFTAIEWDKTTLEQKYFPSINKDKYYIPLQTIPQITLLSLADSSSFYGGDSLPEYSMQGSLTFEMEIPVLMTIETNVPIYNVVSNISVTYAPDASFYNFVERPSKKFSEIGIGQPQNNQNFVDDLLDDIYKTQTERVPDYVNSPLNAYGEPLVENDKGSVGIEKLDESQNVNIVFLEKKSKIDNVISTKLGRIVKEFIIDVDATDIEIQYPLVIEHVPWEPMEENTIVYLANKEMDWSKSDIDPNTIIIPSGPVLHNNTFQIYVYLFEEMCCSKKKG